MGRRWRLGGLERVGWKGSGILRIRCDSLPNWCTQIWFEFVGFTGVLEKLVIYDFVPNGSLANARYGKVGSSPCSLSWEVRLKIAKGMPRGLAYIHEKKHVHGNLKPTNILLGADMEPKIEDFGLEKLVTGDNSYKASASNRNFGSKRSTASR